MNGHPHVVTMGVREQVVKPATKFSGSFAMSCITQLPIERQPVRARWRPRRFFHGVILAIGLVMLGFAPGHAGSASAQFRVIARVIKSCKVSADEVASQAAGANGTINVNCQNSNAPASSSGSASGFGGAIPDGTAKINYSVDDVPGSDGGLKIVTVNF